MTIQEKQERIKEYCEQHTAKGKLCAGCPLMVLPISEPCFEDLGVVERNYRIMFDEPKPGKHDNPYWERICKLSEKQRAKGMDKYGQGLENNPDGIVKRIEHLEEELIDALMYCEWIKDRFSGDDR